MQFLTFAILLSVLTSQLALGDNPPPSSTEDFPNKLTLASPDAYIVYWKANNDNITFEVHTKNSKWLLFGIAGKSYSDVIVASINDIDRSGHFSDRKLVNQSNNHQLTLITNPNLNWILLDAFKNNNYTVVKFYRPIKLQCGNSTSYLDIQTGVMNIVHSSGDDSIMEQADGSISVKALSNVQIDLLGELTGPFKCATPMPKLVFDSIPTGFYLNNIDLIDGVFRFYWNSSGTDIVGEIHCRTLGWVGFGFSPNGGMNGSDVVVGWIKNGVANFTDRFIYNREVRIDKHQDWNLLKFSQKNGFTIFKFQRPIKLCNPEDLTIDNGTPNLIFAYGLANPPDGGDISYHSVNRGAKKLNVLNRAIAEEPSFKDEEFVDFTIKNVVLPKIDTYYYCQEFPVPQNIMSQKRHIFKSELILSERNFGNIHHVDGFECDASYTGTPSQISHDCLAVRSKYCTLQTFAWSFGGNLSRSYPKDTGFPIGGSDSYKYILITIHYNNPQSDIGYIENFSLRHHVTKTLQKHELGVISLGTAPLASMMALPPQLDRFDLKTYCNNKCLNKRLMDFNLTVISINPHTHLTGIEVWTKIIRNGTDIGYLNLNKNYDFNYQDSLQLDPPINITKDDELITQCSYKTTTRNTFTLGGYTTHDEMCFNFLVYYPRISNFNGCYSKPDQNGYIDLVNDLNKNGDVNIEPILNYNASNLEPALDKIFTQWSTKKIDSKISQKFVNFFQNARVSIFCGTDLPEYSDDTPVDPIVPLRTLNGNNDQCSN